MRVDLDARVWTSDGHEAGRVQKAVIDPRTNEVSAFVVSTGGLFGRDVLVSRQELERATRDGDALRLELTRERLTDLPAFVPDDYSLPPAGWMPPPSYAYPPSASLWPVGYSDPVPDALIPGPLPVAPGAPEPTSGLPAVDKGTEVLDSHGDRVGVVDEVRFDAASGELQALIVRLGGAVSTAFGGGDRVELPGRLVDWVEAGAVHLRVDRAGLGRAA